MAKKQRRRKPNATGRNESRFVSLPYNHLSSEAYKSLCPKSIAIYIELKRRYNGSNNGEISLSCREAGVIAHCSKNTASKKLDELVDRGFIKEAKKGMFTYRNATTWILTTETLNGKSPTNEWKAWSKK